MRFDVQIDTSALTARTLSQAKNLAYSTSQALNATGKDVQDAMRVHLDRTYHLRRAGFMYRLIKIFQFSNARQGIPFIEIGVDNKARVLLGYFEEGGLREPAVGKNVAVPITGSDARPTDMASVPSRFTFQKMNFERHVTKDGKTQWKGDNGTFLIPNVGVFKRTAKKENYKKTHRARKHFIGSAGRVLWNSTVVKMLYKLMIPSSIKRIPANLQLDKIAAQQLNLKFSDYFFQFYNRFKR